MGSEIFYKTIRGRATTTPVPRSRSVCRRNRARSEIENMARANVRATQWRTFSTTDTHNTHNTHNHRTTLAQDSTTVRRTPELRPHLKCERHKRSPRPRFLSHNASPAATTYVITRDTDHEEPCYAIASVIGGSVSQQCFGRAFRSVAQRFAMFRSHLLQSSETTCQTRQTANALTRHHAAWNKKLVF